MKKKIGKLLWYFGFNALYYTLTYFAVIEKVEGAKNMVYFLIGAGLVIAMLCSIPEVLRKTAMGAEEPVIPTVPLKLSFAIDMGLTAFFVWHGWIWCALGVLFVAILQINFMTQLRDLSQQNIINRLSA